MNVLCIARMEGPNGSIYIADICRLPKARDPVSQIPKRPSCFPLCDCKIRWLRNFCKKLLFPLPKTKLEPTDALAIAIAIYMRTFQHAV